MRIWIIQFVQLWSFVRFPSTYLLTQAIFCRGLYVHQICHLCPVFEASTKLQKFHLILLVLQPLICSVKELKTIPGVRCRGKRLKQINIQKIFSSAWSLSCNHAIHGVNPSKTMEYTVRSSFRPGSSNTGSTDDLPSLQYSQASGVCYPFQWLKGCTAFYQLVELTNLICLSEYQESDSPKASSQLQRYTSKDQKAFFWDNVWTMHVQTNEMLFVELREKRVNIQRLEKMQSIFSLPSSFPARAHVE